MKTLFTIHAGEFLAGTFIEANFPSVHFWVPSKDTGLDLLVTDSNNQRAVSLQVKFSRDFLVTHMKDTFQGSLRACGWWKLSRKKIANSNADYWILVLIGFAHRSTDFVLIKSQDLLARLDGIHGRAEEIQSYLWVTKDKRCWEARGLSLVEQRKLAEGRYSADARRDFTQYLNQWVPIQALSERQ